MPRILIFLVLTTLISGCPKGEADSAAPKFAASQPNQLGVPMKMKQLVPTQAALPEGAKVFFVEPVEGAVIRGPVKMKFGIEGMSVRPAGEDPQDRTSGHHHVIVDAGATKAGMAVPADETHIHYGKGQTEAELTLQPGKHTLTLQLADGAHLSYGEKLSQTINIEVK